MRKLQTNKPTTLMKKAATHCTPYKWCFVTTKKRTAWSVITRVNVRKKRPHRPLPLHTHAACAFYYPLYTFNWWRLFFSRQGYPTDHFNKYKIVLFLFFDIFFSTTTLGISYRLWTRLRQASMRATSSVYRCGVFFHTCTSTRRNTVVLSRALFKVIACYICTRIFVC